MAGPRVGIMVSGLLSLTGVAMALLVTRMVAARKSVALHPASASVAV